VIAGPGITVNCIAGYCQLGMNIAEIPGSLRHLTPSRYNSALAYYFDRQDAINVDIEKAGNNECWKSQVQAHPAPRQLRIAIGLNLCSGMLGKTVDAAKQP